jgi:predicted  nucleic acid-binding Zn-ribbon protein
MVTGRTIKMPKTETEIAVLQVEVQNITDDIREIKTNIRDIHVEMVKNNDDTRVMLKGMKDASSSAHQSMSEKISALEKWRWMMMGAGVVIGSLGFDTIAKLLK